MTSRASLLSTSASVYENTAAPACPVHDPDELWAFALRAAAAWDAAPLASPKTRDAWRALADHSSALFDAFARDIDISFVDDNPYDTLDAICHDVLDQDRLAIWTGASVHPLWSPEENWRFRATHDLIPHVACGRPIDLAGEMQAFHDHLRYAPPETRIALFTEVVMYACIYYTSGAFPDTQKAAAFPELLAEYEDRFCA